MDGIVAYALAKKAMGSTIGDLENLVTNEQGDIVDAVNEVAGNIGSLDDLTTDDHSNLVHAINEIVADMGGSGSAIQSDWNQNDENADDYIKNRPFYKGDENLTTLIPETTITVTDHRAYLEVEDGGVAFNSAKNNVGKLVKIQYNDVIEYGLITFYDIGTGYCNIYSPNAEIYMDNNVYQISVYNLNTANVVFRASIDNTEINKISSDYLPVPSIEGTGVSSIILNGSFSECKADGLFAVAEGKGAVASGEGSHAEGDHTTASGSGSHAECGRTTASGSYSHAEGSYTTASGYSSHAEGSGTTASGHFSHAEGDRTIANHASQHVFGEFNIADPSSLVASIRGTYVEIVGNGTKETTRSNARTLDWSGNEWIAGNLTATGGTITVGATALTEAKLQELLSLSSATGVSF